jgi:pimeloyl-ACP methyl ester carboxylesterase
MMDFSRRSLMQTVAATVAISAAPLPALAKDETQQTAPNLFVESNGIRYAYRRLGASEGIPLVFLMHFRGTMDSWDPAVVDPLAKHRPVILFGNAGIGLSGGEAPKSIEAMAGHVETFLDALKLKTVDLLGFSIGGYIAQQVALDRPGLVRRLILVGTGPQGGEEMAHFSPEVRAVVSKAAGADASLPILFFAPSERSQAAARAFLSRLAARTAEREPQVTPQAAQAQIAALIAWGTPPEGNRYGRLAELKLPVLVVNGNHDIMIPTINSYILAQHLPDAKLIIYPDAGHGSLFQYHEDFVDEVSRFLQA